jgi:hypothetical protein
MTGYQSKKAAAQDKLDNMEREALKLALEALESGVKTTANRISWTEYDTLLINDAITAIKQTLAQPAQEPVAMLERDPSIGRLRVTYEDAVTELDEGVYPLYTNPPQRPWVGLTRDEVLGIEEITKHPLDFYRAIEAKLKEKNNG